MLILEPDFQVLQVICDLVVVKHINISFDWILDVLELIILFSN